MQFDQMKCPACGLIAVADFVDNGVGMQQCGPFGCESCGWVGDDSDEPLLPVDASDMPF
jgi:rubredoxin